MSIFLAGAGPDPLGFPEVFDRFALEVREHAGRGRAARIAVAVLVPKESCTTSWRPTPNPSKPGSSAG